MVALSPRFATLAVICSLAALSTVAPSANAAVLNMRRNVADSYTARDAVPVIPLPARAAISESGSTSRDLHSDNQRRFFATHDPMFGISDLWMGAQSRRDSSSAPDVVMEGSDSSVSLDDHTWQTAPDGGVIIVGDHKHVDVRAPHDHHHHYHGEHDKVVVKGNDDHVNIHSRSPHHHHHHHGEHVKVVVKGNNDHVNIHSRSVLIPGEAGVSYVVKPSKRFVAQQRFVAPMIKRDTTEGVPGTIDIMSPMDDGSSSQRIASLVLASVNDSDTSGSSDPTAMSVESSNNFVLNASPDDKTQVFLVPLPPVATEMATSSSQDREIRVTLQMPVFDAASASTQMWCATFDPAPPAPAPLTAESCASPESSGSDEMRKSQVFAYNPNTGAVRPMWFDGQGDGSDNVDDSSSGTDNMDPETPGDASVASVTDFTVPSRRDDDQQAVFASPSVSASMSSSTSTSASGSVSSVSSSSTAPSSVPSSYSEPSSMPSSSIATKDVVLMFTPAEPVVMEVAPASGMADSQSSSTMSTMTSSATSSTVSSTVTVSLSSSSTGAISSVSATSSASVISSVSSSSSIPASSGATPMMAMDYDVDTTSVAASSSSSSSSMSAACTPSVAPCDDSTMTTTASSSSTSPTPSAYGALGVQIIAEAVAPSSSSSMSMSSPTSSAAATTTMVSESASPSMTPVSTAPYTWMFKREA